MTERTLRGKTVIAGIGETDYYKHGQSPDSEFKLALRAILAAAKDAGIDPKDIDGFASYSNDRDDPSRLAAALGIKQLRFSNMQWGGGGGGVAAAVGNAAAAVTSGMANCVVAFRALAQGQFARFGRGTGAPLASGDDAFTIPYGVMSPAQKFVMKVVRFMHDHGVKQEALRAISLASYHHAQTNPRAVMYGRPLDEAKYDASRWIVEPFHLFDCCLENDGAAAVIVVSADRAKDLPHKPSYLLGVAGGSDHRCAAPIHNAPNYPSSHFATVAPNLYEMAKLGPKDIDVVQCYENFTGGVLMSLVEHGFCAPEEANDLLRLENLIAPTGRMPLNTSGGNLAECYMHGLELVNEAVRQIRGESVNQAAKSDAVIVIGGPMVTPVSSLILGSEGHTVMSYLPEGLPAPSAGADGLSTPYWEGTRREKLFIQFCRGCSHWQWGPEWICHRCNSFDLDWREVEGRGVIYSYQRVWHPVHPALNGHGAYIAVLVELPGAGNVRMVGNLLGDPKQDVPIGASVEAVFEHHENASPAFTLVQWRLV